MVTKKDLQSKMEKLHERASHLAEQNIEESGVSETLNRNKIAETEMAIKIAENDGYMETEVLVWIDDEDGGVIGEVASKKMICKHSACWIVDNPRNKNECIFIKPGRKPNYYKKLGLKIETRKVPVHILEYVDSCYRSRLFIGQNDKVMYT